MGNASVVPYKDILEKLTEWWVIDKQVIEKLKTLDEKDCNRLCEAMEIIEKILRENDKKKR